MEYKCYVPGKKADGWGDDDVNDLEIFKEGTYLSCQKFCKLFLIFKSLL